MSILITGAGLIAAHSAKELQSRGESVTLYDLSPSIEYLDTVLDGREAHILTGDVTDVERMSDVVQGQKISTIVHTAGLIGSSVSRHPYRGVDVNVRGSMAVIEAARQSDVHRIVFCSSMAVYDFDKLASGERITEEALCGPKNLRTFMGLLNLQASICSASTEIFVTSTWFI
jgi:UDP-glucose 4-epimerase